MIVLKLYFEIGFLITYTFDIALLVSSLLPIEFNIKSNYYHIKYLILFIHMAVDWYNSVVQSCIFLLCC